MPPAWIWGVLPLGLRKFICKLCPSKFSKQIHLDLHHEREHREKPFPCQTCEKGYMLKSKLEAHEKFHDMNKPFECETCNWRFVRKSILNEHKRLQHQNLPCATCCKTFKSSESLMRHDEEQHQVILFQCSKCQFASKRMRVLKKHMIKIHTIAWAFAPLGSPMELVFLCLLVS